MCIRPRPQDDDDDASLYTPSLTTRVVGFVLFNVIYLLIAVCFLGMVYGAVSYPKTAGLYLVLPYYTYVLFFNPADRKMGAPWPYFSQHFVLFQVLRQFLGMHVHAVPKELTEADAKPDAQFVIGAFPHGSFCDYRPAMDWMLREAFPNAGPNIRTLAATVLFRIPVVREVALWTSCVDASRPVAERLLDHGKSLVILPGGEAEQIRTIRGQEIVYLQNRKGFIKLAMRKQVPVVPMYIFGASDYYHTSHALYEPRKWLQSRLGICIPLTAGYWGAPLCPIPVPTTMVFGKPLDLQCKVAGSPTAEEVAAGHAKFVTALRALFDEHKQAAGFADRELQIV